MSKHQSAVPATSKEGVTEFSVSFGKIWTPNHVIQPKGSKLCGQCCVSAITHIPLEVIVREAFFGHREGTFFNQVAGALRWFGWDNSCLRENFRGVWPNLCIAGVSSLRKRRASHWVVIHRGMVFDSCWPSIESWGNMLNIYRPWNFIEVVEPKLEI